MTVNILDELLSRYDYEETAEKIAAFIRGVVNEKKAKGMIVGVSGGLDSAVVAFLGVKAIGAERVHGFFLPDRDTAPESRRHAEMIADKAGFKLETIDLTPTLLEMGCYQNIIVRFARNRLINRLGFQFFRSISGKDLYAFNLTGSDNRIVKGAVDSYYLRDRLRIKTLYEESRKAGLIFPDSFNKTENLVGFASYGSYGDISVDVAPILLLYKCQVRSLAAVLGVPPEIITKPPSPDLFPGVTDEIFLGISYDLLDCVLFSLDQGLSEQQIADCCDVSEKEVKRIGHLKELASPLGSGLEMPCPELEEL